MKADRRKFLSGVAGMAMAGPAGAAAVPDFSRLRADFPWIERETFLNNAGWHPMPRQSVRAMHAYLEYKVNGPGEGREARQNGNQQLARQRFAQLINAQPSEIAFVQSTLMGENLVRMGLGIPGVGGNVVTNDLHYEGAIYMYKSLEKQGLDLRIVKHRNGQIHLRDIEDVVDKKTRLIALSLVSYINGYRPDVKAICDLAHAHGAYVYADVIQAAGGVPIDVRALGLDFCACSGYKWLMGDRGLGYLFVREALQGKVMKRLQYGDRQFTGFQYHTFPYDPPGPPPATWTEGSGAGSFYEVGNIANVVAAGHAESIGYILKLGLDNIRAHNRPLTEKLWKEIPKLGYPTLTPPDTDTPIVSFIVEKPDVLRARLKRANVAPKVEWNQMRVSCSVYNNMQDVDRLLNALS
jgi:selenocysteine lyase/cysteine desulfurase